MYHVNTGNLYPICVHYCVIFCNFVDGVQRALSVCTYTGCDVTSPGSTCPALAHRHHEEDDEEEVEEKYLSCLSSSSP